jgi:hypothetical protein
VPTVGDFNRGQQSNFHIAILMSRNRFVNARQLAPSGNLGESELELEFGGPAVFASTPRLESEEVEQANQMRRVKP